MAFLLRLLRIQFTESQERIQFGLSQLRTHPGPPPQSPGNFGFHPLRKASSFSVFQELDLGNRPARNTTKPLECPGFAVSDP